jgi:hypothetical protein
VAQIFVSHSSADNSLAVRVRECLGELGYDSVFLDVSPTEGLVPGAAWRDQLFTNLDKSDALVFVGTPTANASLWCHSELALARWLRKPVLSLLFDGVDPHELVADIQGINLAATDLSPDAIRPGLVALGLEQATRWDSSRSPFPGLRAFDESYAPVFFGRERQVDQLRQLVDPPSRARQGLVVPVLGPSGSGKSSLVRAGLVAALRPAPDWVVSEPWTPSDAPLAELSLALSHAAKRQEAALDADECNELLRTPGGMPEYLRRLRAGGSVPADARVLVVIDQAEELVTLTAESERKAFFEALALACTPPSPLRVVMTARTDMWDSVSALTNRFGMTVAPAVLHVPPLNRADLARVIAEPAKRSHLTLEDGLLQRLVEDTASGDALPLLAYTLARMTADATDGQLTHELYDKVGGVRGAIASRAAEVAHDARTEAEVAAAILHIVGTGENRPVTRLARVDTVPPAQRAILDDLVDARLVVVRESAGVQVYAPAHEALFSAWPPLAEMISRRHDDLRLRSRLERRAADWHEAGAGSSGLLTGDELDQAGDWLRRSPDLQTPDIAAYVDASSRRERRNRIIRVGVAGVVTALALALAVVVLVNARADRRQARQARVGELAAIAERELVHDPVAAAVALLEGLETDPGSTELTKLAGRLLGAPARDVYTDADPRAGAIAVTVGDRRALATITNGQATILDTRTGSVQGQLPPGVLVAVRRDDRVAVMSSGDQLQTYDLAAAEPELLASFGQSADLTSFAPSGSLLAAATGPLVRLWDLSDPTKPGLVDTWRAPGTQLSALTVLDDGRVLASGDQAALMEWSPGDVEGFRTLIEPGVLEQSVTTIDVDAAGTRALLGGPATTGNALVDLSGGDTIATFDAAAPGPAAATVTTFAAAMNDDGTLVAVFDFAGRGFVFDTESSELVARLTGGHTALVNDLGFGAGGLLVSAGLDGQVRTWDAAAESGSGAADADALCAAFGARIDEASWHLAMGDQDLVSPCAAAKTTDEEESAVDVSSASVTVPDVRQPSTPVLVGEDALSAFQVGTSPVGPGTLETSRDDGRYRMRVGGVGPAFQMWATAALPQPSASMSFEARLAPVSAGAVCGLTFADRQTRLTVTFDGSSDEGSATWFVGGNLVGTLPFDSGDVAGRHLALVRDRGRSAVLVDGSAVLTVRDDAVGSPVDVGLVAVGGGSTCAFDRLAVRSP